MSLTFKPKNTHYHEKYEIEYRCRTKSGEPLRIRNKGLIVDRAEDDSVQRMMGAHQNIDAHKRLIELSKYEKENLQNIIDERTAEASPIFTSDTGLHSGISNHEIE